MTNIRFVFPSERKITFENFSKVFNGRQITKGEEKITSLSVKDLVCKYCVLCVFLVFAPKTSSH
jgi:hypothetical protein